MSTPEELQRLEREIEKEKSSDLGARVKTLPPSDSKGISRKALT
jgi:hypothetical protein